MKRLPAQPIGADEEHADVLEFRTRISHDPTVQKQANALWFSIGRAYRSLDHHDHQEIFARVWEAQKMAVVATKAWRARQVALVLTALFWCGMIGARRFTVPARHLLIAAGFALQAAAWVWSARTSLQFDGEAMAPRVPSFWVSIWAAVLNGGLAISELSAWVGLDGGPTPED